MNIYTISFLLILIFSFVKNKKSLHMLQQNLYNENNRYIKWILKNKKNVFITLDLLAMIVIVIAYVLNNNLYNILILISLMFYFLEVIRIINNHKVEVIKKQLVVTKRIKRLMFTLIILFCLPVIIYLLDNKNGPLLLLVEAIIIYFNYIIILVSNIINTPVEKIVYKYYETKAKNKLKSMTNLKIIGITGSYGKTSSKNILSDILNVKYIARPTPRNLNTKYGLMITINNYLDKFDDIFIAEMGAYKCGEIKVLCDMVHPKYGILTTIGLNHLETFGSSENIIKTKFELIESLPSDGIAILNMDDSKQVSYNIKSKCKKIWIGIDSINADVRACDIEYNHNGCKFNVIFKGSKTKYSFETKLLGNYNIYNILAGIALGKEFGISIKNLEQGVSKVKSIEHRLELKSLENMYVIDDTYNSNPVGAKMALDVLNKMPGTKVVVTPGITELSEKENELNHIFGTQIASVADYIILVGEKKTRPIFEGINESSYNKDKLFIVNSVYDAYNLLEGLKEKDDIYALFENDLPDSYNE